MTSAKLRRSAVYMVILMFTIVFAATAGHCPAQDPPPAEGGAAGGRTIGDVIQAKKGADARATDAASAARAANQALAAALDTQAGANAELKADLAAVGPVFLQDADGSFEVWIPDASDSGYHAIRPQPVTTPVTPATQAPASAPAATVAPSAAFPFPGRPPARPPHRSPAPPRMPGPTPAAPPGPGPAMTRILHRTVPVEHRDACEVWPEGHPERSQRAYTLDRAIGCLVLAEKSRLGIELVAFDGSTPAPNRPIPDG